MARGKGKEQLTEVQKPPTKQAKTPSKRPLEEVGDEEEYDPEDGAPAGRRRTSAQVLADEEQTWKANMPGRGFKNERQLDVSKLDKKKYGLPHISRQGLEFWFKPLERFKGNAVVEFYQNMRVVMNDENSAHHKIVSKVGKTKIEITPDVIAKYLDYERPDQGTTDYPICKGGNAIDANTVNEAICKDVSVYKGGDHIPGKFKEDCRLLNKVIHANLYPRGSDSKPNQKGAELMYVFMSDKFEFDAAAWIFYQLVDFKFDAPSNTLMPFPCMISKICSDMGVTGAIYSKLERLRPGPINAASMNKSKSKSKAPSTSGTSKKVDELRTPPDENAKLEAWNRKLFDQNAWIITELLKGKAHRKWVRKEIRESKHQKEWQTKALESTTGQHYEAPPVIEEEDSDDNEGDD